MLIPTNQYAFFGAPDNNGDPIVATPTGFGSPYPRGLFSVEDEYLTRLYGVDKFIQYRQMVKAHGGIAALIRAYTLPILQADWDVVGGDQEVLDFVRPMIMQDIKAHLRQVLRFPQYGMYGFEQTFEVRDGRTVETGIYPRPPWTYYGIIEDRNSRKLSRILQLYEGTWGYIPAERLVLFVFDPDGESYQGSSLLRSCVQHYTYVKDFYKIDAIGNNRHAVGAIFIQMSQNASEEDRARMENFGEAWQTAEDASLVVSEDSVKKVEVVLNQYENGPIMSSIVHHNQMIFSSGLASFLGISSQNTGSLAREGAEINFFVESVTAVADVVAEVETNVRIKRIVDLNFKNVTEYPELRHANVKRLATNELGAFMQQTATFLTPDSGLEGFLRAKIGAPARVEVRMPDDGDHEDGEHMESEAGEEPEGTEAVHGDDEHAAADAQLSADSPKGSGSFWREPTGAERFVRLKAIDKMMDDRKIEVTDGLKDIRVAQVEQLTNAARGMVKRKEIAGIQTLRPRKQQDYSAAIMRNYDRDWAFGYEELVGELTRQAKGQEVVEDIQQDRVKLAEKKIEPVDDQLETPAVKRMRKKQNVIATGKAQDYAEDMANQVLRDYRNAMRDAMLDPSLDDDEIIRRAEDAGKRAAERVIGTASSFAASSPVQYGRTAAAEENGDLISRGYYSAILDDNTCGICNRADGKELDAKDPRPTVPNPECEGTADRCRCIHVWVLKDEVKVE